MDCTLERAEGKASYESPDTPLEYTPLPFRKNKIACGQRRSTDKWQGKKNHYTVLCWPKKANLEEAFREKAKQWKSDTQFESSTHQIALHPAYQSIIGMGKVAIPWILQDLSSNGGRWYWALKFIADTDPVPKEARGIIPKMKEAWLEWGRKNNYL